MLFLVVLVIALGWAGWFWSWGRDRFISGSGMGLPLGTPLARTTAGLAAPRTAWMARKRRREVLVTLAVLAVLTFVLARSWGAIWALHLIVDIALVVYAWAVHTLENGRNTARQNGQLSAPSPLMSSPRMTFQPITDDSLRPQHGPRR